MVLQKNNRRVSTFQGGLLTPTIKIENETEDLNDLYEFHPSFQDPKSEGAMKKIYQRVISKLWHFYQYLQL